MKRVVITIDFLTTDEEVECFWGDTIEDLEEQGDIMKDWIREAPYNYSMDYTISEAGNILKKGLFNLRKVRNLFR